METTLEWKGIPQRIKVGMRVRRDAPGMKKFGTITSVDVDGGFYIHFEGDSQPSHHSYGNYPTNTLTILDHKVMSNVLDFFRNLTATPDDKLLKEFGLENPTNVPTEAGLKLSAEITYAANRARVIEIAKQMKAEQDAAKKE